MFGFHNFLSLDKSTRIASTSKFLMGSIIILLEFTNQLAGRYDILQQALMALARIKNGKAEKSVLLIGLRGVGKTVLLHRISELAEKQGYKIGYLTANLEN